MNGVRELPKNPTLLSVWSLKINSSSVFTNTQCTITKAIVRKGAHSQILHKQPQSRRDWTVQDTRDIIRRFRSINLGILNYYRFSDNFNELSRTRYHLQFSLAKTLAHKSSIRKIFKRMGKTFPIRLKEQMKRHIWSLSNSITTGQESPMAFQMKKDDPEIL
ncbi:group II intron reverse transcriptase/maturase [Seinonella peptonophila]